MTSTQDLHRDHEASSIRVREGGPLTYNAKKLCVLMHARLVLGLFPHAGLEGTVQNFSHPVKSDPHRVHVVEGRSRASCCLMEDVELGALRVRTFLLISFKPSL